MTGHAVPAALRDGQRAGHPPVAGHPPAAGPAAVAAGTIGQARFRDGVSDVLTAIGGALDDGASPERVLPAISEAVRAWAERQARTGAPVLSPAERDALAQAV